MSAKTGKENPMQLTDRKKKICDFNYILQMILITKIKRLYFYKNKPVKTDLFFCFYTSGSIIP